MSTEENIDRHPHHTRWVRSSVFLKISTDSSNAQPGSIADIITVNNILLYYQANNLDNIMSDSDQKCNTELSK